MRSELAKTRDEYLESATGKAACDPTTLGPMESAGLYLRNRIEGAFVAGYDAARPHPATEAGEAVAYEYIDEHGQAFLTKHEKTAQKHGDSYRALVYSASPIQHPVQDLYEHFLSYSGLKDDSMLRYAYFHGANADCDMPPSTYAHPPAAAARIAELEAQIKQRDDELRFRDAALDESREREGRMREALLRARAWGGMGKGWDSRVALDLMDWVAGGMEGPLPELPDYCDLAALAAEKEQK